MLAQFQYRGALRNFLAARSIAESIGDREKAAAITVNLASVYYGVGDLAGAAEESRKALAMLARSPRSPYLPQALAQAARVEASQGKLNRGMFLDAAEHAEYNGEPLLRAQILNLLGCELLERGRLREAEPPLIEAFRIRVLHGRRDLAQSLRPLGLLRLELGDLLSAGYLLEGAVEAAERAPGKLPNWMVYFARGRLRVAEHRPLEALADFRRGIDVAHSWRLELLPADSLRMSADEGLEQLYAAFIRSACDVYFETGNRAAAEEAFSAAEEIRAASLRATIADARWRRGLPDEYDAALAELRVAQVSLMRSGLPADQSRVLELRHRLAELEAQAGIAVPAPGDTVSARELVRGTTAALGPSEAFIAFHLDEPHSYSWVLTREAMSVHVLPSGSALRARAARFTEAVEHDSADVTPLGAALYAEMFGAALEAERKTRWLLAVDDALYTVPFAALVTGQAFGHPLFLAQAHSTPIVPSARLFASARREPCGARPPGRFLGVGDPIYNAADSRVGPGARPTALQLPRLVGSGREIRACAQIWGGEADLLEGASANRLSLTEALKKDPAVIHFATHFVNSRETPARRFIVLALPHGGDPDYLGAEEIATWRVAGDGLVVLSGCSSGQPERRAVAYTVSASPREQRAGSAGITGLSRAWLAAGAGEVVASLWPTPDDSGEYFLAFYRHLRSEGTASADGALRRAQIEMLQSGTWHAAPRHWSSYFVICRGYSRDRSGSH